MKLYPSLSLSRTATPLIFYDISLLHSTIWLWLTHCSHRLLLLLQQHQPPQPSSASSCHYSPFSPPPPTLIISIVIFQKQLFKRNKRPWNKLFLNSTSYTGIRRIYVACSVKTQLFFKIFFFLLFFLLFFQNIQSPDCDEFLFLFFIFAKIARLTYYVRRNYVSSYN